MSSCKWEGVGTPLDSNISDGIVQLNTKSQRMRRDQTPFLTFQILPPSETKLHNLYRTENIRGPTFNSLIERSSIQLLWIKQDNSSTPQIPKFKGGNKT